MFFIWSFLEPEEGPSIDGLSTSPQASIGESVSLIQPLWVKAQALPCSFVTSTLSSAISLPYLPTFLSPDLYVFICVCMYLYKPFYCRHSLCILHCEW